MFLIAHDTSFHNTMMRDIDIRKDVYFLVVLSCGATMSLLYAFHLDDQVNGKLTIVGVNSAHYTGDFVYTNLEIISCWHVELDGLTLNDTAVETEFVITVPFLGYYTVVLEGTSGILSPSSCCRGLQLFSNFCG